jgi:hypothetical protein
MEIIEYDDTWQAFLAWIESTPLFQALKNDPVGVEIQINDGSNFMFKLERNADKAINLPKELLMNFFENSPWYNPHNNTWQESALIQKCISQHKQLTNATDNN